MASEELEALVQRNAATWQVDPALVKAVIANESAFNPAATSSVGAQGLMQLMPETAASMGVRDAYDPAQNVAGGTRYLRGLLDRFGGDLHLAVAAYNAGPGAVRSTVGFHRMPRLNITWPTCSARTSNTARRRKRIAFALANALALLACGRATFGAPSPLPSAPLTVIFANVAHALGFDPNRVETPLEEQGTITGEGLRGTFHTWRAGDREREDRLLGLRLERTLRIGDRMWEEDENGAVRELRGTLRRRALTDAYIDSGAFTRDPDRARYLGTGTVDGRPTYQVEVSAPGGDPEQIDIDSERWLPVRLQYVQGDGVVSIALRDWRTVDGEAYAFHSTISNGSHAYDLVEATTRVVTGADIPPYVFAPLVARTIDAPAVQTVKLGERSAHYFCVVSIGERPYRFLLDTGAQGLVLDSHIAGDLGLVPQGSMQAYGATRTGGLGLVRLADLRIGTAHLRDVVASHLAAGDEHRRDAAPRRHSRFVVLRRRDRHAELSRADDDVRRAGFLRTVRRARAARHRPRNSRGGAHV